MCVATQTRLSVSFDVCRMSNTGKYLKVKVLFEANKTPLKLKLMTGSISFPQLKKSGRMKIICYLGATYASLEDGASLSDFIIFVTGWLP